MDFMPYEGTPLKGGHDRERLLLALAIGAVLLMGAWGLAAVTPASSRSSSGDAKMSAPSTPVAANIAVSDSDVGPGESESELARHPVMAR